MTTSVATKSKVQHGDAAIDAPMLLRSATAGAFARANDSFAALVGYTREELAARELRDFVHPDDHRALDDLLAGESKREQLRHRARDGGQWVAVEASIAASDDVTVVLLQKASPAPPPSPVSDADDHEANLRGTLHAIATIVEEQNPGYKCSILLVSDGRFVRGAGPSLPEDYNDAIDGFAVGPTVGSCGTAIYWNRPVVVDDIQADPLWLPLRDLAKQAGVAACWSHPFTSASGHVLGALALYSPEPRAPTKEQLRTLRASARMTGLAVERGRAQQALRKQRERELELEEQLRQAAKMEALGVLAGGVAHDFNNVLATILCNAELARDLAAGGDELDEVDELMGEIIGASKRAGNFCKQMLSYAGRGPLQDELMELGELLPQLAGLVQAAVPKKATLDYEMCGEPIYVRGDENQLLQVVMNLVTNAAEALGDDAGHIVVATSISKLSDDGLAQLAPGRGLSAGSYAVVSVSDDGCGMTAETIARIFDPFFTTKFTGRGLGLAAVQGIVRRHRGFLRIDSKPGRGSTFQIYLPTATGPVLEVEPGGDADTVTNKRILIADDEGPLRSILRRLLRRQGYEIVEACDGRDALDRFFEDPSSFDCVLLDLSMPRMSGDEVVRELSTVAPDVPIIIMSGYAEEELLRRFADLPVAGSLQKPIPAADLLAAVESATSKRRTP